MNANNSEIVGPGELWIFGFLMEDILMKVKTRNSLTIRKNNIKMGFVFFFKFWCFAYLEVSTSISVKNASATTQ